MTAKVNLPYQNQSKCFDFVWGVRRGDSRIARAVPVSIKMNEANSYRLRIRLTILLWFRTFCAGGASPSPTFAQILCRIHSDTVGRPPVGRRILMQAYGGAQVPALHPVLAGAL